MTESWNHHILKASPAAHSRKRKNRVFARLLVSKSWHTGAAELNWIPQRWSACVLQLERIVLYSYHRMRPAYVLGLSATGLGVLRSLGRRRIPLYAATWDPHDPARSSRFAKTRLCPDPVTQPKHLLDFLLAESQRLGQTPVLFTAGDAATLFLAEHQDHLRGRFLFHSLPAQLMTALINKAQQYQLAAAAGISIPETFLVSAPQDLDGARHRVRYPAFIKPCYSHRWRKVFHCKGIQVSDPEQLRQRLAEVFCHGFEVVVQSVITGPAENLRSVCCYLGPAGKVLALLGQRKIRQFPVDQGVGTLVESVEVPAQADAVVRFLTGLGYRGPAEVEFKWDDSDGTWKLIEFNVRLWEQNALATACGLDFPYIQYLDLTGSPPAPRTTFRRNVRWLAFWPDLHAMVVLKRRGLISFRQWLASLRGVRVHAFFAMDDPMPCLRFYARECLFAARALWRKLWRRFSVAAHHL